MAERSLLDNGRFLGGLDEWTATGGAVYAASDGDDHAGLASLPAGASVAQAFTPDRTRRYILSLSVKTGNATVTIVDSDGRTVLSATATGSAGVWTVTTRAIGLIADETYTLTIANGGAGTILIDDVWIWYVPKTRAEIAAIVHRKLGGLASDASLSTTASGEQTEGSYTDAIDAGLRSLGALDADTDLPDIRALEAGQLDTLLGLVEGEALALLQRHYATLTDIRVGERDEKLSQISAQIAKLKPSGGAGGGGGRIVIRTLTREAVDYEFS